MGEKNNFQQLAKAIFEEVGGKENIKNVAHCATRLRLNLKDEEIPDDEKLKSFPGVLGVTHAGGQLQIIIGPQVSKLYDEVTDISDFNREDDHGTGDKKEKKKVTLKSIGNGILDGLSGSLTPAIPVITVAAFFKIIAAVFGPDMLNIISDTGDLFILATFVGDAGFYFFPVILGFTAARKFKTSPLLGILLGSIMLHPTYMGIAELGGSFSIFGIPSSVQNYSSTLLPIIMSVWVMSYVEKFFDRHIPSVLKSFLVPALTIAVMLPITFSLVGPIGAYIGTAISEGILNMKDIAGFLGVALIGAAFPFLILTGMHIILITALIQTFMVNGSESFVAPGLAAASFAIMGMALGAALRLRNKEEKALSWSYFVTMLVAGTSEPALYGIGIRYKKPLLGMMIGGFTGGLFFGILSIGHFTLIPVTNILGFLSFSGATTFNFAAGIIGSIIAFAVAAIATYFIGFPKATFGEKQSDTVETNQA